MDAVPVIALAAIADAVFTNDATAARGADRERAHG
jgi:hypothetical protein